MITWYTWEAGREGGLGARTGAVSKNDVGVTFFLDYFILRRKKYCDVAGHRKSGTVAYGTVKYSN
jgi:hypothetical protein